MYTSSYNEFKDVDFVLLGKPPDKKCVDNNCNLAIYINVTDIKEKFLDTFNGYKTPINNAAKVIRIQEIIKQELERECNAIGQAFHNRNLACLCPIFYIDVDGFTFSLLREVVKEVGQKPLRAKTCTIACKEHLT